MRPPLARAHQHACKELVKKYNEEWQLLVEEYLLTQGWKQEEVVVKKWSGPKK